MSTHQDGMSLVEVMVALFIVALTALSVIPMFALAAGNTSAGAEDGLLTAIALEQMEELVGEDYAHNWLGGSLSTDVTGYFDTSSGYLVRWEVTENLDPPNSKTLSVRVIGQPRGVLPAREVTVSTLRARN